MVIRCWTFECPDRIYLNGYVPAPQVGGQVVTFLHDHCGMPIASPAVFEQIGTRFRQAVARFAENNDIPMIKFKKGIRKAGVMEPLLGRAARAGRPRVVAIGWAQEFQLVWTARKRDTDPAKPPQFSFAKTERRVTCDYFYIWDQFWGPGFIKVCAYFPYPVKVCVFSELRENAAAQKPAQLWRRTTNMPGKDSRQVHKGCDRNPSATESGHTVLNRLLSFSSLLLVTSASAAPRMNAAAELVTALREARTCLAAAARGALKWHYPRSGFGVRFCEG
jgi:hypothetical protein